LGLRTEMISKDYRLEENETTGAADEAQPPDRERGGRTIRQAGNGRPGEWIGDRAWAVHKQRKERKGRAWEEAGLSQGRWVDPGHADRAGGAGQPGVGGRSGQRSRSSVPSPGEKRASRRTGARFRSEAGEESR